ncbi:MAG: cyclic nucleotide-binding domain-containing protein [Alphaproteobacteria bacterium]|nr:cyclic nucleotide-binding domain-containing protein [Alphaproteobacteria bacterium]TAD88690.1 MAG: cyclic nucleotide-binding domain-containing protein [Alphaproteobacteria bacterium]
MDRNSLLTELAAADRQSQGGKKVLDRRVYAAGAVIFQEGRPGSDAFIVESGAVEISRTSGDRKVVLGTIPAKGIFGEMALIDDKPRLATATAVGPTVCIVIPKAQINEMMAASPPFIRAVVKILIANIRSMAETMNQE